MTMADATMLPSPSLRSLQFNDNDIPADTTALTVFWHVISAIIWICGLYQIYKSRRRRARRDDVWDNTLAARRNTGQSQSSRIAHLSDEEILHRQVELIEQASKRREHILQRFEKDHTIMVCTRMESFRL